MTPVRLTKTGRAGLKAVLDADQLDRHDTGLRAPGWNAVVDLPDEWVEPVKPPLPVEPPVGSFVACGADGNLLPFFRRWSEGWSVVGREPDFPEDTWAGVVEVARRRALRDPVLMVPAPEPVALPWHSPNLDETGDNLDSSVSVHGAVVVDENREVHLASKDVTLGLPPAVARAKAYALLTAADQAEGAQTHA